VHIEEPVSTTYKGIEVFKPNSWVQGPVMLQTLNVLENFDLRSMGYNTPDYIHTLYQAMNLSFADRDFYYGDPYFPPEEPIKGLLSKDYARDRAASIVMDRNDPTVKPGDPYPYQGGSNPFMQMLQQWQPRLATPEQLAQTDAMNAEQARRAGTTSIQAADAEGWVVSITPSGGWAPAYIAGHTGIGLSQRMPSFVMDAEQYQNPYNVLEPGKRPRATLTPGMALKDGKPFLSFAVQGGDFQDQNLVQFFLNMVEFGMDVQLPGMLTAVIQRPPVFNGKVVRFEAAEALRVRGVKAVLPVLLDRGGMVAAKGLVNSREQLDCLLNAHDMGAPSIQQYIAQQAA
jgi:gamma-glutamyltranspeptidase/glutathione hydrolase